MTPRPLILLATALCLCSSARAQNPAAASRPSDEARTLLLGGQFREALRASNEAVARDPKDGLAFAARARVRHALNAPAHEKEDAERALALFGKGNLDAGALAAQSGAYLAVGKTDK